MMRARLLVSITAVATGVHSDAADDTQDSLVLLQTQATNIEKGDTKSTSYGDDKCKCIAIEGLSGNVDVVIANKTVKDLYPSELGSYCSAWDEGKYPGSCDGDTPEDWCAEQWCYVDPCDCDLTTNPSPSYYLDGATFEGKQIFYSYVTCGSTNYFNDPPADAQEEECDKKWDEAFGSEDCPCIGINKLSGTTDVVIDDKTISDLYPADLGSACAAWDEGKYPGSCDGSHPEEWCSQAWCYVDKNNCKVKNGPFESYYLKKGKFQGEPLTYSYLTCGGMNTFDPDSSK